jgi:hypothetical protein
LAVISPQALANNQNNIRSIRLQNDTNAVANPPVSNSAKPFYLPAQQLSDDMLGQTQRLLPIKSRNNGKSTKTFTKSPTKPKSEKEQTKKPSKKPSNNSSTKSSKKSSKKSYMKPTRSPTPIGTISTIISASATVNLSNGTNTIFRQLQRLLSGVFSDGFKAVLKKTIQQLVKLGLKVGERLIDVSIINTSKSANILSFGFRIALQEVCSTTCGERLQNTTIVADAMAFLNGRI